MAHEAAAVLTQMQNPAGQGYAEYDIVLKSVSHPELGDICIVENLFAIGRTEPPFASYAPEIVADLSRRHARIFCEYGAVYIADLDSKNGTTVNGVDIQQKISRLHDGDEICFGRGLTYKVHLGSPSQTQRPSVRLASLTLTPERTDCGLQPIIITKFPFLISKADDAFGRYKNDYPHQVQYLSRRHAHIFLKGNMPFLEDLGSTNGTFVNGKRLDEHAVPLDDGGVVGFGGNHFVYTVSLQKEEAQLDPTVTKLSPAVQRTVPSAIPPAPESPDKTTFVAAADSFLDIFCIDQSKDENEPTDEQEKGKEGADNSGARQRPRGKVGAFLTEARAALSGDGSDQKGLRLRWWSTAAAALLVSFGAAVYFRGGSETELKELIEAKQYQQAVAAAAQLLAQHPERAALQTLGTEALLKEYVPQWLEALKTRQFDRADQIVAAMKQSSGNNPDAQPLLAELEWMVRLERFAAGRQQADAPIRIYADEEQIKILLKHWDDDTQGHQRALARIASYVPEFKEPYATALSHLRRLQGENAVYLTAIERLKSTISTELDRDKPEALTAVLDDYAQKYPRIAGMDALREDLRQYIGIHSAARERSLGALAVRLASARFVTPPFQESLRAQAASDRFPPTEILQQFTTASNAWRAGNTQAALEGLQRIANGPWRDGAMKEISDKQRVIDQFDALRKARGAKGYEEQLLAFYVSLDPEEDTHFMQAIEPELKANRDKVLARAKEHVGQAGTQWRQYQENGGIDAGQRLEGELTERFQAQARLLAQAHKETLESIQIHQHLKADYPAQWGSLRNELQAEMTLQRNALLDLRDNADPRVLKAKLELLGEHSDERPPSKTAN